MDTNSESMQFLSDVYPGIHCCRNQQLAEMEQLSHYSRTLSLRKEKEKEKLYKMQLKEKATRLKIKQQQQMSMKRSAEIEKIKQQRDYIRKKTCSLRSEIRDLRIKRYQVEGVIDELSQTSKKYSDEYFFHCYSHECHALSSQKHRRSKLGCKRTNTSYPRCHNHSKQNNHLCYSNYNDESIPLKSHHKECKTHKNITTIKSHKPHCFTVDENIVIDHDTSIQNKDQKSPTISSDSSQENPNPNPNQEHEQEEQSMQNEEEESASNSKDMETKYSNIETEKISS